MRARVRYAVVAAVALCIGITGTATAAKLITGRQVKDGSLQLKDLSKKARKALKGQTGPAGAAGPAGPAGLQGPKGDSGSVGVNGEDGLPGQSGSTAPALIFTSFALSPGFTFYGRPNGGSTGTLDSANAVIPPGVPLVARDFAGISTIAPGVGQSYTITLMKNNAATALSCQISGTATTCTDPESDTVALAEGDLFAFRAVGSAGAAAASGQASIRIVF